MNIVFIDFICAIRFFITFVLIKRFFGTSC